MPKWKNFAKFGHTESNPPPLPAYLHSMQTFLNWRFLSGHTAPKLVFSVLGNMATNSISPHLTSVGFKLCTDGHRV